MQDCLILIITLRYLRVSLERTLYVIGENRHIVHFGQRISIEQHSVRFMDFIVSLCLQNGSRGLIQWFTLIHWWFIQCFLPLMLAWTRLCQIYTFLFFLLRIHSPSDVLGKSLADLQKQFSEILARSQWEKEEAQVRERKLHEEMALQQEKLANGQEEFKQACERALEARVRKGGDSQRAAVSKCPKCVHQHSHHSQHVSVLC